MRISTILAILLVGTFFGCSAPGTNPTNPNEINIESGSWRFVMNLDNKLLPFNGYISFDQKEPEIRVINGDEEIILERVEFVNDSLKAFFPVFQSELQLRVDAPGLLSGKWIDHSKDQYSIPITGEFNQDFRFTSSKSNKKLADRFKVVFDYNSDKPWDAILKLNNDTGELEGTFMTETGDYRFLDGNIMNNKVYLSTFDGSHAFYFEADIKEDSLVNGIFKSGNHYSTDWKGSPNKEFELRAPEKLTFIKEGYKHFDFSLPNQDGDTITWKDLGLSDKVVIVDIMGSWCPNCLDANRSLQELQAKFGQDKLEILTIAFERTENLNEAREQVFRMQDKLGANRKFLFGGKASKEGASKAFPMLNHIMSYPTLIFIDKDREVRHIYTGFYGPGTGKYYSQFMSETDSILQALISEPA